MSPFSLVVLMLILAAAVLLLAVYILAVAQGELRKARALYAVSKSIVRRAGRR